MISNNLHQDQVEKNFVSILIINWNNPTDTKICINSLINIQYKNYHVLVIDNGSNDNSIFVLTEEIKNKSKFTLVSTGKNLGFSGGVNYGILKSLEMNADYIWLLNNDTEVTPNCLCKLVNAMQNNPDIGIAGSKILLTNHKSTVWHAGATFSRFTGKPQHIGMGAKSDDLNYCKNKVVEYVTGCSLLIRKEVIDNIGFLDDRYFLYYEEADYCLRASSKGWKSLYVADSILWHKVAASAPKYWNRSYYEVRNRLLFTVKHRLLFFPIVLLDLIKEEILKYLWKKDYRIAKSSFWGIIDFFLFRFGKVSHNL